MKTIYPHPSLDKYSFLNFGFTVNIIRPIVFPYLDMYCCYYGTVNTVYGFGPTAIAAMENWHCSLCERMYSLDGSDTLIWEIRSKLLIGKINLNKKLPMVIYGSIH